MPPSRLYETERREGLHRHEIFFGEKHRSLSIKYGLVVFLTPEMHNMSNRGVHFNSELDQELKSRGQRACEEHYPELNFFDIFSRNYL